MKAIRVYGPRDVRYEEVPDPVPGPDEVLVRIEAVGLCATDVEVYDGTMFYLTSGLARVPFTPGHEWSGRVVACGRHVRGFVEGDQVVGECSVGCRSCSACLAGNYHLCRDRTETGLLNRDGGFAELIAFPYFFLHHCDQLTAQEAALVEPTAVAINAVRSCHTTPADCVAVIGVGPIGLLTVQAARVYGARRIVAIDINVHRLELAKKLGADAAIHAGEPDMIRRVSEATDGHMIDVAVEASGKPAGWAHIPKLISPCGRIILVGLFASQRCSVDFDPLIVKNVTLHSCLGGPNLWAQTINLMQAGKIKPASLITHEFPFSRFADAVELSRDCQEGVVKVMMSPSC